MINKPPVLMIFPKNDIAVVHIEGINYWLVQGYYVESVITRR